MIDLKDTITAVATAPGLGGIGIVRLSGPQAVGIAHTLFRASTPRPHTASEAASPTTELIHRRLHHGYILAPDGRRLVDEVLVAYMRAPNSYTREDVVEIHCHAGTAVLQRVLGLTIAAGARLAEPGEFTRRAFLNGRIDLTQAEAVADLIAAKTETALDMAAQQLSGRLGRRVDDIRSQLQSAAGQLEALIEFPEDLEGEDDLLESAAADMQAALTEIRALLQSYQDRHIFRDGIQVSVIGRPNVGKSSLLNALLEKERAIVTALPGTTRDLVIDSFQVDGIPIQIADTAGMRDSADLIEKIGIQKTQESIAAAQLILFVVDLSAGPHPEDHEIYQKLAHKHTLLVLNKSDLCDAAPRPPDWAPHEAKCVAISAKYRHNLEALKQEMVGMITQGQVTSPKDGPVPNLRQKAALDAAATAAAQALAACRSGESEEFIVFHLQSALNGLGTITGETHSEDLLDLIFDRFCIGK